MQDIRIFIGSPRWCSVLHVDPMLLSLVGSTNPASCNLLRSSWAVWGVCMLQGLEGVILAVRWEEPLPFITVEKMHFASWKQYLAALRGKLSMKSCRQVWMLILPPSPSCGGTWLWAGLESGQRRSEDGLFYHVLLKWPSVWLGRGRGCSTCIKPSCQTLLPWPTFNSNALLPWSFTVLALVLAEHSWKHTSNWWADPTPVSNNVFLERPLLSDCDPSMHAKLKVQL